MNTHLLVIPNGFDKENLKAYQDAIAQTGTEIVDGKLYSPGSEVDGTKILDGYTGIKIMIEDEHSLQLLKEKRDEYFQPRKRGGSKEV